MDPPGQSNQHRQMIERRQLTYSGQVQGVGFRYTARSIAQGYHVTGYVRNLPDGRVELVAEGSRDELDRFLDELAARMSGQIRSIDCQPPTGKPPPGDRWPRSGEFAEFTIRH